MSSQSSLSMFPTLARSKHTSLVLLKDRRDKIKLGNTDKYCAETGNVNDNKWE